MDKSYEQFKPTKKQVVVPIIIFVVALCLSGILLLITKVLGEDSERTTYLAPTTEKMQIEETGEYTIFLGVEANYEGKRYEVPEDYEGLQVKVLFKGSEVEVKPAETTNAYGVEGDMCKDVYTFAVKDTGEYTFEFSLSGSEIEQVVVAVGRTQHVGAMLGLTLVAGMSMLLGICQFLGYLIYNGISFGIYYCKKKQAEA